MDMAQLKNFIVTAEQGSMTKAAELLLLSQSALSRSITTLETELGVPLFDRKNRKIVLNRYGKTFLSEAKQILNRWEHTQTSITNMVHPESGNISIGFVHSLGIAYAPQLVRAVEHQQPKFSLTLQEAKANYIVNRVLANDIDFGFATQFQTFAELEYEQLFKDNLVLVVSSDHPFASRNEPILIDEIAKEPFIQYNPKTELKQLLDAAFAEQNTSMNIMYEGLEISSIIGMVKANLGVAFMAESIVDTISEAGLVKVPVTEFKVERPIYLIHKKQGFLSIAARQFKQMVMNHHNISQD
ncbi:LysR family transcriptional regulator [Geomicrobium sp. JCM 19037]|uniref:LysR family transcriptional regulator n=1 Tax=unclassified Geomicrobium TaxID=2628951 RepID=UPI00045F1261|nr:LysR family transcriptional regulator [Geomicrobium sp. JCM 19037]GAK04326.1 LysR family transcriptional regulator [Geomicrobium sp. JCM 19037]